MKTLLISTALILGLAGASLAQSQETEVGVVKMSEASLLVGDMIGEHVYNFRGGPIWKTLCRCQVWSGSSGSRM